jgi:NADH-ubiquinone oxidoreductase chain 1
MGGYLLIDCSDLFSFINFIYYNLFFESWINYSKYLTESIFNNPIVEGLIHGLTIGLKSCIMIFTFIWVRASFPRIRFDQLMSFCWTVLLPVLFALIILVPSIIFSYDILPINLNVL